MKKVSTDWSSPEITCDNENQEMELFQQKIVDGKGHSFLFEFIDKELKNKFSEFELLLARKHLIVYEMKFRWGN